MPDSNTMATVKRSDKEILKFITELPGGNVPQYARLLNTTPARINALLMEGRGRQMVRAGMIRAPELGRIPAWATARTQRGSLRSSDVDHMFANGLLPKFIQKQIASLPSAFKDDALNYLREVLDQTGNHTSFESQVTSFMEQDRHRIEHIMAAEEKSLRLESEIARYDRVLERANQMATLLEDKTNSAGATEEAAAE